MAVTIRAPSSTARASHGRGSSLTLGKMKAFLTLAMFISAFALNAAEPRSLIARFEVVSAAFEGRIAKREAVMFYTNGRDVEIERLGSRAMPLVSLGTDASAQLLTRLRKIDFPRIDYQKHFDALSKEFSSIDGQEVEVELRINGVVATFKMWNPGSILPKRPDDKAAAAVVAAAEAFVLSISKGAVFFQ